ncbi:MAG: hypothetical protein WED05_09595 [Candidatus Atabeyarchaeum deiterrae]
MRILTERIEEEIRENVVAKAVQGEYDLASQNISSIITELYNNIPDNKRTSYGIVYTIKVLSENIYSRLVDIKKPPFEIASRLYEASANYKSKMVALGVLSFYGVVDYEKVLPYFESSASSPDWNVREISQMFFRKLIKKYPNEMKKYLLQLLKSEDGNVRRFVGETLRPVQENAWFYSKPEYPLPILRNMFKESFPYARTSVGNNLSDLARKLPDLVYGLVKTLVESGDRNSFWIAYRACRNLVKKQPNKVMDLLKVDEYKYKTMVHRRS